MRPGGLLVLELPHPEELFSGSYYSPDAFVDAWDASAGDKSVLVEWGREGDEFDSQTQVLGSMNLGGGGELCCGRGSGFQWEGREAGEGWPRSVLPSISTKLQLEELWPAPFCPHPSYRRY